VVSKFGDYDLKELKVPVEAWPIDGFPYKGTKSYTVRSRSGAVPSWLNDCSSFSFKIYCDFFGFYFHPSIANRLCS